MQRALIIGSSGGIGSAIAEALRGRGVEVTGVDPRRPGKIEHRTIALDHEGGHQ